MNQSIKVQEQQTVQLEPGQIIVKVQLIVGTSQNTLESTLNSHMSFKDLTQYMLMKIFGCPESSQFEELIEYKFGNLLIQHNEPCTLGQLGLKNGSELDMFMRRKSTCKNNKQKGKQNRKPKA